MTGIASFVREVNTISPGSPSVFVIELHREGRLDNMRVLAEARPSHADEQANSVECPEKEVFNMLSGLCWQQLRP